MSVRIAEYIWLDSDFKFRSKLRTIDSDTPEEWTYDGSSTGQATVQDSEITLKPVKIFNDPFRGENDVLVWCMTYTSDDTPTKQNTRRDVFTKDEPWFGLEQEYFITENGIPVADWDSPHYCSIKEARGRMFAESHYMTCLKAGIKIGGMNAEVANGQWEFQIGPSEGIAAGDNLWMARYILERLAAMYGYDIDYSPKPFEGTSGSGCHTNYSTKATRKPGGVKEIHKAIEKLSKKHDEHMCVYGANNVNRMTGTNETAEFNTFSCGIGERGTSIRIPRVTINMNRGYFEDRRPSANCDPYIVTKMIYETTR